jgi:hypothetical protein
MSADKGLLGRIRTIALQEPFRKSGGRGAGVHGRRCTQPTAVELPVRAASSRVEAPTAVERVRSGSQGAVGNRLNVGPAGPGIALPLASTNSTAERSPSTIFGLTPPG